MLSKEDFRLLFLSTVFIFPNSNHATLIDRCKYVYIEICYAFCSVTKTKVRKAHTNYNDYSSHILMFLNELHTRISYLGSFPQKHTKGFEDMVTVLQR